MRCDLIGPPVGVGCGEKVVDLEFSPFADTLLATASEDGTAKLTMLPANGLTADITQSVQTLEGHQKKLSLVRWHPTANNILSTLSYDNTVKVSHSPSLPSLPSPSLCLASRSALSALSSQLPLSAARCMVLIRVCALWVVRVWSGVGCGER